MQHAVTLTVCCQSSDTRESMWVEGVHSCARLMSALTTGVPCMRTMWGRPDALMSWSSCGITGLRIRARHPSHYSRPRDPLVFVGSAMTDPAMEAQLSTPARRWHLRPTMLVRLPISWASDASPFSGILAADHVP